MSQTFWEIDAVESQPPAAEEQQLLPESEQPQLAHSEPEPPAPQPQLVPAPEPAEEPQPAQLTVSAADFSALEERILRAVEVVKRERQARAAAEERAVKAEAELAGQSPLVDQLRDEVRVLHSERDQVRQRVERLLSQLDALEL